MYNNDHQTFAYSDSIESIVFPVVEFGSGSRGSNFGYESLVGPSFCPLVMGTRSVDRKIVLNITKRFVQHGLTWFFFPIFFPNFSIDRQHHGCGSTGIGMYHSPILLPAN